jgi:hypothetical protein
MTNNAPSTIALKKIYDSCDADIQKYYSELIPLIDGEFSYQTAISYCFLKVEQALFTHAYTWPPLRINTWPVKKVKDILASL